MKITLYRIVIFCAILFSCSRIFAGDATISTTNFHKYIKVNNYRAVTGKIINVSGTNILSYRTGWKLDNEPANNGSLTNISGGGLPTGGSYMNFTSFDDLRTTVPGPHVLKMWVKATGDTNATNDTLTFNFTALSLTGFANKVNLFEESTGTWCQYCPEGATAIATIKPLPNTAIAVFHHNDIYSTPEGETYFNAYFPADLFTPGAMINMSEYGNYVINTNRSGWYAEMNSRANSISPVQFTINPTYNITSRQLDVSIVTNFKTVENGDYYTNAYIVENGVVGTQVNATNPYTHDNLLRKMLGGSAGTSGVIPETPVVNTNYANSYNITIPATWNVNNLSIIAMVFKKNGALKSTLNAARYDFTQLLSTTGFASDAAFTLAPNPADNYIKISDIDLNFGDKVSIYNTNGQLVIDKELNGESSEINIESLPVGMYLIKIKTDTGTSTKKFIKE